MKRTTVLSLAVALLAVVSLAVVAATLTDTTAPGGDGSGFGGGVGDLAGDDAGSSQGDDQSGLFDIGGGGQLQICLDFLANPLVLGLVGLVTLGTWIVIHADVGELLVSGFVTTMLWTPIWALLYLLSRCGGGPGDSEFSFSGAATGNSSIGLTGAGDGIGGGARGAADSVSEPQIALTLALGLAIVGAVVTLLFAAGADDVDEEPPEPEADSDPEGVVAVGRAAGAAADRIDDDAAVENEIYRAWEEMTRLLDVDDPETATPAEFADAAVAAGMDRDDVEALTDLFAAVRYGGFEPTPEREETAVAALRRIESTYADGGGE